MAVIPTQDNKYGIRILKVQDPDNKDRYKDTARLVNLKTGAEIPEDEPVFLFRAKDMLAAGALDYYATKCLELGLDEQARAVQQRVREFLRFEDENETRVGTPTP